MSVFLCICPFSCNFFEASHWPSGHMIRSRPLIGRPSGGQKRTPKVSVKKGPQKWRSKTTPKVAGKKGPQKWRSKVDPQPLQNCIGATIRNGREIQCLPYAISLNLKQFFKLHNWFISAMWSGRRQMGVFETPELFPRRSRQSQGLLYRHSFKWLIWWVVIILICWRGWQGWTGATCVT